MLRSTLRSWAKLLLIVVIISPHIADAKSSSKKEPVDLTILEQSDGLLPYMTAAQRIEYFKLEVSIESAESDLRSGQHLASTKPSTFDPDRDLKPIIKRGEELVVKAEAEIDDAQRQLVQLLTRVETQKVEQQAVDLTKYDYTLEAASYEEALAPHCRQLLEAAWGLGYETLFFDGAFIQDSEGTQRAGAEIRNQIYDILVKIDGTTFSVTIPVDLQLKADTTGADDEIFTYENFAIFEEDKKALLAIEMIVPEGSSTGLLSIRAIDLASHTVALQELVKITDLAAVLGFEGENLKDGISDQVALRDESQTIEIFSNLSTPYTFELVDGFATDEVTATLTQTLLKNSKLKITDSDFIKRGYGQALEQPDAWVGKANARLKLKTDEADGSYLLSAQANDGNRTLSIGTLTLKQAEESESALAEVE